MSAELLQIFGTFGVFIVLMIIIGIYCILATSNLVRAIIGIEILIKAVTLLLILAGYITKQTALIQSLVITLIVIEVAIMVVAGGVILCVFRQHKTIDDSSKLTNLKG